MEKENLKKVISNLYFTGGKFIKGDLVIEDCEGTIFVKDTKTLYSDDYDYYDKKSLVKPNVITNKIWEDWAIKTY